MMDLLKTVSPITMAKIALAVVGLIAFGYGIHTDSSRARVAGIIIVGIGVMLRFFSRGDPSPPESEDPEQPHRS